MSYKAGVSSPNILFVMLKHGWFDETAWEGANYVLSVLSEANADVAATIWDIPVLIKVDFSSLGMPRQNYDEQVEIDPERVRLFTACLIHYNMDPGLVARYVRGEYLAKWRDTEAIIAAVQGLISDEDVAHMRRILDVGCPAKFNWEEPAENKEAFIRRGNNPSVEKNKPVVNK